MATAKNRRFLFTIGAVIILIISSGIAFKAFARKMSQQERDAGTGFNGSFEHFRNSLPVNWIMYTPSTVPDAAFQISSDSMVKHEGKQSLLFVVNRCGDAGGWKSPGLANETPAVEGATYRIRLWVRSEGAQFRISTSAVSALKSADVQQHQETPADTGWHQYEYLCTVARGMKRLRLELNVLSPGRLWVDDMQISQMAPGNPS